MPTRRLWSRPLLLYAAASLSACNVHQSALAPFGEEADAVRRIAIVMLVGAVAIGAGVAALMIAAVRAEPERLSHTGGMRLVGWLGGVIPTIVLLALLVWTLPAMSTNNEGDSADFRHFWRSIVILGAFLNCGFPCV